MEKPAVWGSWFLAKVVEEGEGNVNEAWVLWPDWLPSQGLGGDAAVGVPMPANLSQINIVNIFQEETKSTLHQGPSVRLKDSSR